MKIKIRIITIVFLLLNTLAIKSQTVLLDTIKGRYESETIFLDGRGNYLKNNKTFRVGFIGNKLEKEFLLFPDAQKEFKIYKTKSSRGLIITGIGFVTLFSAPFLSNGQSTSSFSAAGNQYIQSPSFLFSISGLILLITGGSLSSQSIPHFNKALWLRNRDVLLK